MNANRASQLESDTVELLNRSTNAQLETIYLNLNLPRERITNSATPSQKQKEVWDLTLEKGGTALADLEEILREQQGINTKPFYWLNVICSEIERRDVHCKTFYTDLVSRLFTQLQIRAGDLRHFDEGNAHEPDAWSAWSLRAVQRCEVLVCLYSKSFFGSPYCGRIWAAFQRRLVSVGMPENSPRIFPILWTKPDEFDSMVFPKVVRDLEFPHQNYGDTYSRLGLRFLVEHKERGEYQQAYNAFLDQFSSRLLQQALGAPLNEDLTIPPLNQIESVFHDLPAESKPLQQGSDYAYFIYVAARKNEIKKLRAPDGYDDQAAGWMPYHPMSQEKLGLISTVVAAQEKVIHDVIPLDKDLVLKVREAEERGNIIIMLVDPWTAQLPSYMDYLAKYDRERFSQSAILVCWNDSDSETQSIRVKLSRNLTKFLSRTAESSSPDRFRNSIGTIDQLRKGLIDTLISIRRKIADETLNLIVAAGETFIRPENIGSVMQPEQFEVSQVRKAESPNSLPVSKPCIEGPSGGAMA